MAQEPETSLGSTESAAPESRTPKGWHAFWDKEIRAFMVWAKDFRKCGNKVVDRFLDEKVKKVEGINDFRINLFYTNVSTLQSMLYGSTPKVEVKREFDDPEDDVARVASVLFKRILTVDIANSGEGLSAVLKDALQDRLLPGLGVARVYYNAEFDGEALSSEQVIEAYVHWQDFAWGWARVWPQVPWVAFREHLTKEEISDRFGEKVARNISYDKQHVNAKDTESGSQNPDTAQNIATAEVWEIWHKETRKVFWYCESAEVILDIKDDPLELSGFFPLPKPMFSLLTTREVMPKADYQQAEDLYNEIDVLQTRISMVTRACKVVGVYDQASDGIKRMFTEGFENDLIPVDNWAAFAERGGIQGQIDWLPIDVIAGVLDKLRAELNNTIELLYQVTGMSDILRGANTEQYTSDGTNQLKAKFGSIRIQSIQEEFARFASDLESLKVEVVSKHYDPPTIYKQSLARFLPAADQMLIVPAIQLMKSSEIKWRINIKPESIAMVDYAQLKAERTEYLTSVATFLQSAGSLIQQIPESTPVLMEMLKWGMAGFKGSDYLEGTLDQAIEAAKKAPPKQDDQGQAQSQAEMQAELAKIQAKLQADMQIIQVKAQAEQQKEQLRHQSRVKEEQAKNQGALQKIMADLQADLQVIRAKLEAETQVEMSQAENSAAEAQVEHEHNLAEAALEHSLTMEEMERNATLASRQQDRKTNTD